MTSITKKITNRIKAKGRGWVFCPNDFLNLGSRAAVDQALYRLTKDGFIRRLDRGIYDYPKQDKLIGILSPNPDDIARVLADGDKVYPSGAVAANMANISVQVPAKLVYMTTHISRTRKVGNQTITLKAAKIPFVQNDKINMVLQALSYLGKANIDDQVINKCTRILSDQDISGLYSIINRLPGWLSNIVHKIIKHIQDGQIQQVA